MDESNGSEDESKNRMEIEKALREYDQALEIGHHNDIIINEVAAIVWGANTLLLGFVLEVPCHSKNQRLVIVAAVLGVFLSLYVLLVHKLAKINQKKAYEIARQIERDLSFPYQINIKISDNYPKWKFGLKAVWAVTVAFVLAWVSVLWNAFACFCRDR